MPDPLIDADMLHSVAQLSRLGLSPAETRALQAELVSILDHFQAIQQVDTEGVEPLAHVLVAHGEPGADEVRPWEGPRETLVPLSANHREGFFVVPRVLEDEGYRVLEAVDGAVSRAADAVETAVISGLSEAMQVFNQKPQVAEPE